jgi:adenine-specific DNA-methyltransferase
MITTERQLAALAGALVGKATLPAHERRLIPRSLKFPTRKLASVRARIRAGDDPLGEFFCRLRSPETRREQGATYTPKAIIDAMIAWAADESTPPKRVVDAGAGSGRFLIAAAKAFPAAELVAVELDPLACLIARANAAVLGFSRRLMIEPVDYRALALPVIDGPTLFIGNPPYVRHHDITPKWKAWFANAARSYGFNASGLAGLHVHFFLKTRQLAKSGDYGAFITAAEWLDVNYGSVLRRMLADGLGGTALHVIDPKAMPFSGTFSTGAITCFRVGRRPDQLTVRTVASLDNLAPLSDGRGIDWSEIEGAPRWSILLRNGPSVRHGEIELGELFRVHRGQVTGCNAVWIAGPEAAELPARFLFPAITKARELIAAGESLDSDAHLRKVIDLPVSLDELNVGERRAIEAFLAWAKRAKADKSFIATHRRAWWSVGLKRAAPILCTYMARRAPAFVRNRAAARHLNIAHGLYPLEPLSDAVLDAIARHLSETVCMTSGRVYAGGLVKFEPGEVARLHIPELSSLHAPA